MNRLFSAALAASLITLNSGTPAHAKGGVSVKRLVDSAIELENAGRPAAAIRKIRRAIRADRHDPFLYLHASRLRLKMGDRERSAGNLHYAIRRARREGSYARLAEEVRSKAEYALIFASRKNRNILELYDSVEKGEMTEAQARRRILTPDDLRDALAGLAGAGAEAFQTPVSAPSTEAGVDDMAVREAIENAIADLPEQPSVVCATSGCGRERLNDAIARGDRAFEEGRYEDAAGNYELALTISELGSDLDARKRARIFKRVGVCMRRMGLLDESVKLLLVATKVLPHSSSAAYELAATYALLGEDKKAVGQLKKVFKKANRTGRVDRLVTHLRADLDFETLMNYSRYEKLVKKFAAR